MSDRLAGWDQRCIARRKGLDLDAQDVEQLRCLARRLVGQHHLDDASYVLDLVERAGAADLDLLAHEPEQFALRGGSRSGCAELRRARSLNSEQ
jgi:hypothetical protein